MPYVPRGVYCHMCFLAIPISRRGEYEKTERTRACFLAIPISRRGEYEKTERTRAFYSYAGKVWECRTCHAARQLSDLAGSRVIAVWRPAPVLGRKALAALRRSTPATAASPAKPSGKPSETDASPWGMTA